jgi:hypothetical protein
MTDLSPQAQAVLNDAYEVLPWMARTDSATIAAAALRAAADQVVPEFTTPWNSTITPMISAPHIRAKFLAIAAELEAQ